MPIRNLTKVEVDRLKALSARAIEIVLVHVTATCLRKSIIDATGPVRSFLASSGIHDFSLQGRGARVHGVKVKASYLSEGREAFVTVSFYKPSAKPEKGGDPRFCIYGLKERASPGDIIGLVNDAGKLAIINLSRSDIVGEIASGKGTDLVSLIERLEEKYSEVAMELLEKLKSLAACGPVCSVMQGSADTAIGRTLEYYLGINMNSSKDPDYKGIELKASRIRRRRNRPQLFCRVPNWKISKFKSSAQILANFGYGTGTNRRLKVTVRATGYNQQGLALEVESDGSLLYEKSNLKSIDRFATWEMRDLHVALARKHKETFWVSANATIINGVEHFEFKKVVHTRAPLVNQFSFLVESGAITMDHLIDIKEGRVREGGPSFKISPNSFDVLFPPTNIYQLV